MYQLLTKIPFSVALLTFFVTALGAAPPSSATDPDPIPGFFQGSVEEAFAKAQREQKVVMIDVYASWCGYCQALEEEVYRSEAFRPYTEKMVCLRVDGEQSEKLRDWSVRGYPTVLFFGPDRTEIDRKVGYADPGRFLMMVESVLERSLAEASEENSAPASVERLPKVSRHVVALTNRHRRQHGREPLRRDETLQEGACRHSRDMLKQRFFGHVNPDGEAPSDRVAQDHRRLVGTTGENIWRRSGRRREAPTQEEARALAQTIVEDWMQSPGHRENLLRSRFSHLGVCSVRKDGELRVTQSFANVWAYFDAPLPEQLPPSIRLPVSLASVPRSDPGAVQYDLWAPDREQRVAGPFSFDGYLRTPKEEGRVRVRFYFPRSAGFTVVSGPGVTVSEDAPLVPRAVAGSTRGAARDSLGTMTDTTKKARADSTTTERIGW